MSVCAPGKLVVTGAYAVLYGAHAVVFAVDRYARATGRLATTTSPEFRAAMQGGPWPIVDTSEMVHRGVKMGLGSSAASLVVALAVRDGAGDLQTEGMRSALFERAFAAHHAAQGGGSGIDIAASVWGGAQSVAYGGTRRASHAVPEGLTWRSYFSGTSVRTSAFVAKVAAARTRSDTVHILDELVLASDRAAQVFAAGDASGFVEAAARVREGLVRLGVAADVPIITPSMDAFHDCAVARGAVALPAGAGGGDVVIALSAGQKVNELDEDAARLGWTPLELRLDRHGVCDDQAPDLATLQRES
jgi:phosphomevalonate kinase